MGRSAEQAKRLPSLVVIDEWQTGLDAQLAQHFERLLTLARFKRVSFWLINQLPAQVGAAIQLSERDRFVCLALAKTRVMLMSDVALLTFPSARHRPAATAAAARRGGDCGLR